MTQRKRESSDNELMILLATRFRQERNRLGLSAPTVAHYCGVSVASVFNWESGKVKIPLTAIAMLRDHGFDTEALMVGKSKLVSVCLLNEGVAIEEADDTYSVPEQLLLKHRLNNNSAFAYFNLAHLDGLALPGEMLLMGMPYEEFHNDIESEVLCLFRPKKPGLEEFLCKLNKPANGRVLLVSGKTNHRARIKTLLNSGSIVGDFHCKVGIKRPNAVAKMDHHQRFAKFIESIREKS